MAVSHVDDDLGPFGRKQSIQRRQVSLYASRIKPATPPQNRQTVTGTPLDLNGAPQLPQIPSLPISPRWDSLSNGSHLMLNSPTSPMFPPHAAGLDSPLQPHPQPLSHRAVTLPARDLSRLISDSQYTSSPLKSQPSLPDMRAPEPPAVENFSRPRKPSLKQPISDAAKLRLAHVPSSDHLQDIASASPQALSWHRPRGPSVSSFSSTSPFPSSPLSIQTGDVGESRSTRARNATAPPLSNTRPPFGSSRVDSAISVPASSGAAAPWVSGDELRSSFRSQLTSSTAPGTALTERSSVLTKDSSVSSLYANADEPSLEDVMGMYEKGFADDDDDEDEDGDNYLDDQDSFDNPPIGGGPIGTLDHHTRPTTAMSEPGQQRFSLDFGDMEPLPTLVGPHSTLDAEIRQSKMIFTSLAFTSTVPAISGSLGLNFPEKRESSQTVESEPALASESNRTESSIKPFMMSIPPKSPSRSASPSPIPAQLPVWETEDPDSRDRYGFKKQNQSINREQYDSWNKDYSQYLTRRRKKWVAYLKDNALMTDQPNRFPAPNAKTKRFVRKGIPPEWRGAAWFYYAGGPAILAKHSGLYDKLLGKEAKQIDVEAIERDLHRTFPDNIQFKPSTDVDGYGTATSSERESQSTMTGSTSDGSRSGPPGSEGEPPIISSLRRVLLAFAIYNPRIGYCQSLNFIAGLLLLFVETEEQCFWLLNVITRIYLPGTHEMSLEGSKVDLGVLMTELRDTMPGVWDKIGGDLESEPITRPVTSKSVRKPPMTKLKRRGNTLSTERLPPITLCMTAWFMSCFIGTLPIETTLRVWDVFFYEGSKTLFRVALAIFKLGESEIKAVSDPMEMFGVVQALPRKMIDANQLMDVCFRRRNGFGHLSQDVIEERRQERRDQVRQDVQLQRGKSVTGGGILPEVDVEVQRKGTLFGRRRKPRPVEA